MNVLITGCSRGIGYALAKEFVSRVRNIKLILISRSEVRLMQLKEECIQISKEAEILPLAFDLNDLSKGGFPELLENVPVDIVINNAGVLIKRNFQELNEKEMIQMIKTNLILPAILIQKIASVKRDTKPCHIVNIGSMAGFQGSVKFPGMSIYGASKAGLASLTESLAVEFKEKNIYVNCLAIGAVQTDMLEEAFPGYKAPVSAEQMASFIAEFAINGHQFFNGKVLPVAISTP
jgi:short-subunit dehydrogenase